MNDEINFREIAAVLIKRWKLIVSFGMLCMLCAFAMFFFRPPVYEAKSRILFRQLNQMQPGAAFAGPAAISGFIFPAGSGSAANMIELVDSRFVRGSTTIEAAKECGMAGGENIGPAEVKSKILNSYLEISVRHSDPLYAKNLNDAYVNALSVYWNKLNYSEAHKKMEYIETELPKKQKELTDAENRLKNLMYLDPQDGGETVDIMRIKREVDILNSVYMMLRKEKEQARLEEAKEISPFSDVEYAELPVSPVRKRTVFNTLAGLMIGLIAGVFAALVTENLSPKNKG